MVSGKVSLINHENFNLMPWHSHAEEKGGRNKLIYHEEKSYIFKERMVIGDTIEDDIKAGKFSENCKGMFMVLY